MTTAFIVEGHMEQKIIQRLCPGVTVRRIGVNGDHVELSTMAKHIAAQIELLNNRHYPINIIFDREKRSHDSSSIIELTTELIEKHEIAREQFNLFVPDRTIENWILPFLNPDCSINTSMIVKDGCEGCDGKSEVKAVFRQNKLRYVETVQGVDLFCALNPSLLAETSPTFRPLKDKLDSNCRWLVR
ncbi:MAG: hypothetical protein ACR652_03375 [Methylocystis sp.]|uniref:hypothetical protein n=1 Tax=Methylocystis sp. TaxID=1911079 RepID=UPI003DA4C853